MVALLGLPGGASAARGLKLGLTDPAFASPDPGVRSTWMNRAKSARADMVLFTATWSTIAPSTPPANPTNPADPGYDWGTLDAAVRDATARGFQVMISVNNAPAWAEGKHRPSLSRAPAGTWMPSASDLQDFAKAIATRYSGTFTDPNNPLPGPLPRVSEWQLWSEPNLSEYLTPQWKHRHPVAPVHYRKMLTAYYRGIKSVNAHNVVVTGGTAPYGDPPGGERMPPVVFWRSLLCLRGQKLKPTHCPDPAHFDVAAHHPINQGPPTQHAFRATDITTPDIGKLWRILHKAERTHRVRPGGHKPIWATEIWWISKPPAAHGVPLRRHARWLEQSFYLLWKQHVSRVVWFEIRDITGIPTGLFFKGGRPKPAYRAYRFPFVADRRGHSKRVRIWGEAPHKGHVLIERKVHHHWRRVDRARAGRNRVFTGMIRLAGHAKLRAQAGGETSLVWQQK